jgi:hypothetical protein
MFKLSTRDGGRETGAMGFIPRMAGRARGPLLQPIQPRGSIDPPPLELRMTRAELQQRLDAQKDRQAEQAAREARTAREANYRTYRRFYIRKALPAAKLKVEHLEREAARLGVVV